MNDKIIPMPEDKLHKLFLQCAQKIGIRPNEENYKAFKDGYYSLDTLIIK